VEQLPLSTRESDRLLINIADDSDRNWSYLFYVLAGLGAIPLVLGYFAMPWDRRALTGSKVPKIDWIGGFLVTSGLSLFMFSLTQSGVVEKGWSEPCESSPT
jgi:hypothetical protein